MHRSYRAAAVSETYRQQAFAVPPDATELIVIRHGASAALEPGETFELVEGHGDPPLRPRAASRPRTSPSACTASRCARCS